MPLPTFRSVVDKRTLKRQTRCGRLTEEVDRLSSERDKLMDIGNSLRADLNRALSNSYEVRCNHATGVFCALFSCRCAGCQATFGRRLTSWAGSQRGRRKCVDLFNFLSRFAYLQQKLRVSRSYHCFIRRNRCLRLIAVQLYSIPHGKYRVFGGFWFVCVCVSCFCVCCRSVLFTSAESL